MQHLYWQFQGLLSLNTGRWESPTVASTLNAPGNATRPNSFAIPLQNTLGTTGRNVIQGPGVVNLDGALHRQFRIREGMDLALRVESFNFSNTPHFNN
ncbi:MAG: hypothetical protein ND866_26285, partial [Pyrinomonadaceae bacterium]|nr:hypothetical protein [Pyrinomonadaceae bacterium]